MYVVMHLKLMSSAGRTYPLQKKPRAQAQHKRGANINRVIKLNVILKVTLPDRETSQANRPGRRLVQGERVQQDLAKKHDTKSRLIPEISTILQDIPL